MEVSSRRDLLQGADDVASATMRAWFSCEPRRLGFARRTHREYDAQTCWALASELSAAPDGRGVIGRTVAPLACFCEDGGPLSQTLIIYTSVDVAVAGTSASLSA